MPSYVNQIIMRLFFEKGRKIEILNINNIEEVIITTNFNEEEIPKFDPY